MRTDRHNLARYIRAQEWRGIYRQAYAELRAGRKRTHWIWFILPRLGGTSEMSTYYGLGNRWAARAYLAHPVLGQRLLRCVEAILASPNTLYEIFGAVDEEKVRDTAELFASIDNNGIWLTLLCKE